VNGLGIPVSVCASLSLLLPSLSLSLSLSPSLPHLLYKSVISEPCPALMSMKLPSLCLGNIIPIWASPHRHRMRSVQGRGAKCVCVCVCVCVFMALRSVGGFQNPQINNIELMKMQINFKKLPCTQAPHWLPTCCTAQDAKKKEEKKKRSMLLFCTAYKIKALAEVGGSVCVCV